MSLIRNTRSLSFIFLGIFSQQSCSDEPDIATAANQLTTREQAAITEVNNQIGNALSLFYDVDTPDGRDSKRVLLKGVESRSDTTESLLVKLQECELSDTQFNKYYFDQYRENEFAADCDNADRWQDVLLSITLEELNSATNNIVYRKNNGDPGAGLNTLLSQYELEILGPKLFLQIQCQRSLSCIRRNGVAMQAIEIPCADLASCHLLDNGFRQLTGAEPAPSPPHLMAEPLPIPQLLFPPKPIPGSTN